MTVEDIVTLIQAVSEKGLTSFEYKEGDQKLVLKKMNKEYVMQQAPAQETSLSRMVPAMDAPEAVRTEAVDIGSDNVVTSPLVGTFYAASSPEAEPFVKVGDRVKKGQVLGIIEAMKLMNEIESEFDGVVEAVLVNNEDIVEFAQPLFRIR